MTRIAIRVDASVTMGSGHLRRCLALAHALRERGAEVALVCRELDASARPLLAGSDWPTHWLRPPAGDFTPSGDAPSHAGWAGLPWAEDVAQTVAALRVAPPDWLLIDHYAFDARWHAVARQALGCRLAVIDDLADRPLDCDLLLDQNWHPDHRAKYAGRLRRPARLLGGPRYALLGPTYRTAPGHAFHETVASLGIFLGGSDPLNLSPRVLRACREHAGFTGLIEVVSTSANPHLEDLRQACARWPQTRLTLDQPDLASFHSRHDLHIGAGGGATWERCCLGAPTLALVCADNQTAAVPALAELGAVAPGTTPYTDAAEQALGAEVRTLLAQPGRRRALGAAARCLVDGLGAERVALALQADRLQVRPATMDDAALLHAWRNHPATRAVSADSREITFEAHCAWLNQTLADPQRHLLLGEIGKRPVGSIRFDRQPTAQAEVSLYLDPHLHGLGLGPHLLRAGQDWLRANAPDGATLRLLARVLPGNLASARLFETAGYAGGPTLYTRSLSATESPTP